MKSWIRKELASGLIWIAWRVWPWKVEYSKGNAEQGYLDIRWYYKEKARG